jgi:hypothetical protein
VQPPVVWPRHPHALYGVFGYAIVLVAVTLASISHAFNKGWNSAGVLDRGFFERGEWWRVVTALTLHADMLHLLSNLAFGALFGYPAARLFGPGVAWLLILVGGALAYGIDAQLHPPEHYLLGASTAVFTALGLIAAYGWRRHLRNWTPLDPQRIAPARRFCTARVYRHGRREHRHPRALGRLCRRGRARRHLRPPPHARPRPHRHPMGRRAAIDRIDRGSRGRSLCTKNKGDAPLYSRSAQ